ncbi:MAG: inositol monophosphatase family protein [Planctomycetota bacterium]|nr:inositol monophosphatase family protein [Planctomycetota bacterium]MDA1140123.1 inositol monophosphatase family protein [Planctomycetota bacterium]
MSDSSQINTAIEVVREAGQIALEYFLRPELHTELKADRSLLSEADAATEQFIIKKLNESFPHYPFIGEETISDRAESFYEEALLADRTWVLDPIDGTNNFVAGNPVWCVSLALMEKGKPTLGVVYFPALNDEMYYNNDAGLWRCPNASREGHSTKVTTARVSLDAKPLFMVHDGFFRRYDVDLPLVPRISGCTVLNVLYAVMGKAGAASQSAHLWDFAAPLAFAEGMGATMVGAFTGKRMHSFQPDDFYLDPSEPRRLWKVREQTLIAAEETVETWRNAFRIKE